MARPPRERSIGCMRRRATNPILVLLLVSGTASVAAQVADSSVARPSAPFFNRKDALAGAGFAMGAFGLAFADQRLAHTFQDPSLQESVAVRRGADFFEFMGDPAAPIIGLALYGAGRFVLHDRRIAAVGLHGLEAMLLSAAVTGVIKGTAGRARPYVHADTLPFDFDFGRGLRGRDYASFPSGHTSTAFAMAASTTAELSRMADEEGWWPGWKWVIGGVMYGGAGLVGVSRMYHDQHWASDVVAGAAIGTFSGIKTVSYSHRHPGNRADRWFLAVSVLPAADGAVTLAWALPGRP